MLQKETRSAQEQYRESRRKASKLCRDAQLNILGSHELVEPPTYGEVEQVIARMKNNRAPGEDNLVIELFKYGGKSLKNKLHRLICYMGGRSYARRLEHGSHRSCI